MTDQVREIAGLTRSHRRLLLAAATYGDDEDDERAPHGMEG
jgi:hypothetical protein